MSARHEYDDADTEIQNELDRCVCGHERAEHAYGDDAEREPCDECDCPAFTEAEPDYDDQDGEE